VAAELGRNAAYAVIAADLCVVKPSRSLDDTWKAVGVEFRKHTGKVPAGTEQGEVKVAMATPATINQPW
jgi:Ethanolamine utilization protein EutJ (predicted chaperonin)